mmetsp:Transcript_43561/g.64652  ORF Transcript_43561/g.64652 Transcript_43561/m.64652 type:complete len:765 (-) Transcript_43561:747-3041(-)
MYFYRMYRCIQLQYCIIIFLGCSSSSGTYVYPKQSQPFLNRRSATTQKSSAVHHVHHHHHQHTSDEMMNDRVNDDGDDDEDDGLWKSASSSSSRLTTRTGSKRQKSPINIRSAAALLLHSLRHKTTIMSTTALSAIASTSLAEERQQVQQQEQEQEQTSALNENNNYNEAAAVDEELAAAVAEAEATDSSVIITAPKKHNNNNNRESVHLKLNSEAMLPRTKKNEVVDEPAVDENSDEVDQSVVVEGKEEQTETKVDDLVASEATTAVDADADEATVDDEAAEPEPTPPQPEPKKETAMFHTYKRGKKELQGLNVSKKKFEAWVKYTTGFRDVAPNLITTKTLDLSNTHHKQDVREDLRRLWKERILVCDRTELLTRYHSDEEDGEHNNNRDESTKAEQDSIAVEYDDDDMVIPPAPPKKRGGFEDLLHLYADRFAGILQDEIEETEALSALLTQEQTIPPEHRDVGMLTWLQREYGLDLTSKMQAHHLLAQPKEKQCETMQHFLDWFRSEFPYYYDRCDSCNASLREDKANEPPPQEVEEEIALHEKTEHEDDGDDEEDDDDDDNGTFLGYVYPSEDEVKGKAGRTELYHCHKCAQFTRFPRCNSAKSVLENKRGRCGEYSMLLYRMLRSLGHDARWVVDWADHVWAEVRLPSPDDPEEEQARWIHLDPCEAAMDENLLYENWGKQQTYIMAFHTPTPCSDSEEESEVCVPTFPLIEDVTDQYTSDTPQTIQGRREESAEEVQNSLEKVTSQLDKRLHEVLKR